MAFSDNGRWIERIEGRTRSPLSDSGQTSRSISIACLESGTSWGRRIFIRSAGMCQTAFSKLISDRRIPRTSPGRVMVSATSCKSGSERGPAVVVIDRTEQCAQLALVGNRGTMFHLRLQKRAAKGDRRIVCRPQSNDGISEYAADRATEFSGCLTPTALFNAFENLQDLNGRDLGYRL